MGSKKKAREYAVAPAAARSPDVESANLLSRAPQSPGVSQQSAAPIAQPDAPPSFDFSQISIYADHAPAPAEAAGLRGPIMRSGADQAAADAAPLGASIERAKGSGTSLDQGTQGAMEHALGVDLSAVTVHTDSSADQLSRSLDARAFTTGQDIFFRQGEYSPGSRAGRELIAHEVAHVAQHERSGARPTAEPFVSQPSDPAELEASAFASQIAAGQPTSVSADPQAGLHRSLIDDFVLGATNIGHDIAEGVGLESHDEAEAARLAAFIEHGTFGPTALVPPTNIGGFDASYDPAMGVLFIDVNTGVNFVNGLSIDASNVITANHTDLAQAATDGMNLAPADRAAFVADFNWTTAQEDTFISLLQQRVESAWGLQFSFICTRPAWESLSAEVVVTVNTHKGAVEATDHLKTTTYKVPESGTYNVGAFVDSNPGSTTTSSDQDPHNNEVVMSSTHVNPTPQNLSLLQKTVSFEHDSAVLSADAQATLNAFAVDFKDANLDLTNPVELVGHASSPGDAAYNNKLAQARIDAVKEHLKSAGFTGINDRVTTNNQGEAGATEDAEWRRVDLIVGSGEGQLVASHEFGHVFGLKDEYSGGNDSAGNPVNPGGSISGSGLPVGTVTGHDAMARAIGAPGSIAENNDNIMSLGNTVRPQHYATFGWALQQVTGIAEWQVV